MKTLLGSLIKIRDVARLFDAIIQWLMMQMVIIMSLLGPTTPSSVANPFSVTNSHVGEYGALTTPGNMLCRICNATSSRNNTLGHACRNAKVVAPSEWGYPLSIGWNTDRCLFIIICYLQERAMNGAGVHLLPECVCNPRTTTSK